LLSSPPPLSLSLSLSAVGNSTSKAAAHSSELFTHLHGHHSSPMETSHTSYPEDSEFPQELHSLIFEHSMSPAPILPNPGNFPDPTVNQSSLPISAPPPPPISLDHNFPPCSQQFYSSEISDCLHSTIPSHHQQYQHPNSSQSYPGNVSFSSFQPPSTPAVAVADPQAISGSSPRLGSPGTGLLPIPSTSTAQQNCISPSPLQGIPEGIQIRLENALGENCVDLLNYRTAPSIPSSPSAASASSSNVSMHDPFEDSPSVRELCEMLSESPNVQQTDFSHMILTGKGLLESLIY